MLAKNARTSVATVWVGTKLIIAATAAASLLFLWLVLVPAAEQAEAGTRRHLPPRVAADQVSVTVDEGRTATNTGTYSDTRDRDRDRVAISASVGTITKTGRDRGTWNWSLATTEVPADRTQSVTITARDSTGRVSTTRFNLTTRNVIPPFGPGNWPGPDWRPYADSSPFNKPLPANLRPDQIDPDTSAIIDRVISNIPYGTPQGGIAKDDRPNHFVIHTDGSSGEPTYYSQPTDPLFTLHCTYGENPNNPVIDPKVWGACPLEGKSIRIPADARTEGNKAAANTGSTQWGGTGGFDYWTQPDAHMTIVDQAAGVEYDLWQVHTDTIPSGGGDLYFSWGGITNFNGNGLASEGDATAARFGSLAGRVRAEEFAAGKINHALFIGVNCDSGRFVYPARKSGRPCSQLWNNNPSANTNAPPMGARLQLNMPASEIDALPVPAWKKTLLHAMAEYGAFIGDTGASGYFVVEMESGNQYTSMDHSNKWITFAQSNGWPLRQADAGYPFQRYHGELGRFADGIDWKTQVWSKLRIVKPCVSEGTCP